MARVKHKFIWCPVTWFPNHFAFCPSEKAWQNYRRRPGNMVDIGPYPIGSIKACTSLFQKTDASKHRVAIVTVGELPPGDVVHLLTHEAVHVWQDIRDGIGEDKPSSEFEAYAVQNIAAELFDAYEKTRGPLFVRRPRPRP